MLMYFTLGDNTSRNSYADVRRCTRPVGVLRSPLDACTPARSRIQRRRFLTSTGRSVLTPKTAAKPSTSQRTLAHQRSCGTPCGIRECVPTPVTDSEGGTVMPRAQDPYVNASRYLAAAITSFTPESRRAGGQHRQHDGDADPADAARAASVTALRSLSAAASAATSTAAIHATTAHATHSH